ncbi:MULTISPECIES: hypothetical protein [unclassified Novosphingobium]|uniref:hypothetical protein n=1 Tax=unclassified Novosphingobium TaxID=2644732 RepID=UPI00135C689A|nr:MULTISPECIES: hypothetical protein [unclassified Novosphingobium]
MTQALNYTVKALDDLMALRDAATTAPADKAGVDFIIGKLRQAEVFLMPDYGMLLDRSKPRPEVPGQLYRPPFPIVALEYQSADPSWAASSAFDAAPSSKRIALAWEWDGSLPVGMTTPPEMEVGQGVFVASVSYYDALGCWVPTGTAALIPYEAAYAIPKPSAYRSEMVKAGRVPAAVANAASMVIDEMMMILPVSMARLVQMNGPEMAVQMFSADLMDEVNAYCDLAIALQCTNVSSERHPQPEKLNRSRAKAGKPALKAFHVLKIAGQGDGGGTPFGGRASGLRSHLRRGHVRRLAPDRITWVNACMVRGSRPGFADKHYTLPGAA